MQFVGIPFDQRISFKDSIPANYIERDMQPPIPRASGLNAVVHDSRSPNACRRTQLQDYQPPAAHTHGALQFDLINGKLFCVVSTL